MKFTLAAAVVVVAVVAAVEEEVVVVHVQAADSRHRRLPLARHLAQPRPVRPLGQVPALVLDLPVAPRAVPGPQAALLAGRLPKVALAQAPAVRQAKRLRLHSVQPEQVPMLQAAAHRPARSITSSMFPVLPQVQAQQQDVLAALPLIFCKVVLQPSARPQAPPIGQSLLARQSAQAQRPPLRVLVARESTPAAPAPAARTWPKTSLRALRTDSSRNRTAMSGVMKSATNTSKTIPAISGKKTPAGRPMP